MPLIFHVWSSEGGILCGASNADVVVHIDWVRPTNPGSLWGGCVAVMTKAGLAAASLLNSTRRQSTVTATSRQTNTTLEHYLRMEARAGHGWQYMITTPCCTSCISNVRESEYCASFALSRENQ